MYEFWAVDLSTASGSNTKSYSNGISRLNLSPISKECNNVYCIWYTLLSYSQKGKTIDVSQFRMSKVGPKTLSTENRFAVEKPIRHARNQNLLPKEVI